ncbi:MAG TPA: DUF3131 domain-containing protein [Anaeromyxobacter sp.]
MTPLLLAAALAAVAPVPPADLDAARTAWRYFERNTDPASGLVRSVEGYPSATAWDVGSSLLAALAAGELGLVSDADLDARVGALLQTLASQPLYAGALPNKAYDTASGRMTDYRNQPAPAGIGYSAIDVGRLVSALVLLGELHPRHRPAIERVLARWDACRVVRGGELHGAHVGADGKPHVTQEGRLGYEQYAAKAFALLGQDVSAARRYDRFATEVSILGVRVPRDRRDARRYGAVDAVVTEPWVLDAFEFGLEPGAAPLARMIFDVQKRRWERTGTVTALSEGHLDRPPWFVYDAIWADGRPWRTVSPEGAPVTGLRALSTKAALALAALYPDDPYAAVLRSEVARARNPERGWFAGVYEDGRLNRSLNANTNGVILEAALYAAVGPLHADAATRPGVGAWRARLDALGREGRTCVEAAGLATARGDAGAGSGLPAPGAAGVERAPPRPAGRTHAAGSFYVDYRGADRGGAGGLVTVFPHGFWFLRGGGESTPYSPYGRSRFLWGLGYDDWHDGTFSATVHNWGPLRPEDGVGAGVDKAELNVGYKVPRACAGSLCLSAYPSVTVPFEGGPWVSGRLTLTVAGKWFAMGGLGRTVPGVLVPEAGPAPPWHLFWGIGRNDWSPGSIFISYYDWGPDARQRTGNGILAVGVNWQF